MTEALHHEGREGEEHACVDARSNGREQGEGSGIAVDHAISEQRVAETIHS